MYDKIMRWGWKRRERNLVAEERGRKGKTDLTEGCGTCLERLLGTEKGKGE
jgi:hypothetical protein